jgi:hypothetical protein
VNDAGAVDVLEASEDLVEQELDLVIVEGLVLEDLVQIRIHQTRHQVSGWTKRHLSQYNTVWINNEKEQIYENKMSH